MPDPTIVVIGGGRRDAAPIVAALASRAPVLVQERGSARRPAPGALCCCVLDPFADAPLEDVWPRWARAADVSLVVLAPAGRSPRPERAGLLRVADVVVRRPADGTPAELADAIAGAATRATGRRRAPGVPRIGVVTPWPPDPAGPAFSMQALVAAAPADIALDIVRAPTATDVEGWSALVCSLGDSPYHVPAWQALTRARADVLLHDTYLGNLYEALLGLRVLTPAQYRRVLLRDESHRLPAAWRKDPPVPIPRADADRLGLTFLGDVLDRADRILVHSAAARELVLAERPDRAADIRLVIHGGPSVTTHDDVARDPDLVVALGYPRDPDGTLAAFAHARHRHPRARLAITGDPGPPAELQRLARLADTLGVADAVTFDGWVDHETWAARLRTAAVALQLRGATRGESSATIAACMAAGLPVLTTSVGAVAELPSDALVRLPAGASGAQLGDALADLLRDPDTRASLAAAGRRARRRRQPADAARSLVDAVCDAMPAGATRRGTS
ncbi:glycosyltransferase [Svornostia abyssi]|uniref:Glycosyltransferase n=1 Tax=Svornostia abyssi TaxID=2898438 RepID=A0ABY5PNL0_9ACTN|nr:glycosyltransferase [Parviterribacteraceae bacterium J379]